MSDEQYMTESSQSLAPARCIWALVPTKELAYAKSRLAPLLGPTQRRALVLAMLRDVLTALLAVPTLAGVAIVGRDPLVRELGMELGVSLLRDTGTELNGSLTQGAAQLAMRGADGLLVMPGDVPLVTPGDVAALVDALQNAAVALAPAHDGGGTNSLGLRLPSPLTFQFGLDSFALHVAQAGRLELPTQIYRSRTLGLDIDTPEDLHMLEELAGAPTTHATLREVCWQQCAA